MSIQKSRKPNISNFQKEKTLGRSCLGPVNPRGHRTKHRPPLLRSLCCAVLRSLTHFFSWPFIENFYRASMFTSESNKITETINIFSVRHGSVSPWLLLKRGLISIMAFVHCWHRCLQVSLISFCADN